MAHLGRNERGPSRAALWQRRRARAVRPCGLGAQIGGSARGDTISLGSVGYSAAATSSFVEAPGGTSGTLTVFNCSHGAALTLLGSYMISNVVLKPDNAAGTAVTLA